MYTVTSLFTSFTSIDLHDFLTGPCDILPRGSNRETATDLLVSLVPPIVCKCIRHRLELQTVVFMGCYHRAKQWSTHGKCNLIYRTSAARWGGAFLPWGLNSLQSLNSTMPICNVELETLANITLVTKNTGGIHNWSSNRGLCIFYSESIKINIC